MPEAVVPWAESGGLLRRAPKMPEESQTLARCIETRERCQQRIEAALAESRREWRETAEKLFVKIDDIRDRLQSDTAAHDAVRPKRFPWREVAAAIAIIVASIAAAVVAAREVASRPPAAVVGKP